MTFATESNVISNPTIVPNKGYINAMEGFEYVGLKYVRTIKCSILTAKSGILH